MKVWTGSVALVGMLASGSAIADMTDGNKLLKNCQEVIKVMDSGKNAQTQASPDLLSAGQCLGIVEGVRSTMFILNGGLAESYRVCFPKDGINNGQAVRIVEKYLRDHPEQLNEDQTFLTMMAYKQAYPCK